MFSKLDALVDGEPHPVDGGDQSDGLYLGYSPPQADHKHEAPYVHPACPPVDLGEQGLAYVPAPLVSDPRNRGKTSRARPRSRHHLLDLPETEREPVMQPHTVAGGLRRVSMALVQR